MRSFRSLALPLLILASLQLPVRADIPSHVTIGSEDDPDILLLRPVQVEEGPDGDLYVLDAGDARIKVFAPDGTYRRALAGEGEGPGYFQRVDGASFGFTPDGRLFFAEYIRGHRWITSMERDGTDVRTLSPRLDTDFGVERALPLADGGYLVQLIQGAEARRDGDLYLYHVPRSLVRLDAEGEIVSRLERTEYAEEISFSPNGGAHWLPVTPAFAWCRLDDGNVIWSDGLDPTLHLLDAEGRRIGGIETPLPDPEPVTREQLGAWQAQRRAFLLERNPQWWQSYGRVIEEYDESLHDKPALEGIALTPAGNLLVTGGPDGESEGVRYWLLKRDGTPLADRVIGALGLHLSKSYALFFTYGEDGETLVHALRRPADEAAAFEAVAARVAGE